MSAAKVVYLDNDWEIIETITLSDGGALATGLSGVIGFFALTESATTPYHASLQASLTEVTPGVDAKYKGTIQGADLRTQFDSMFTGGVTEIAAFEIVQKSQDYRAVRSVTIKQNRKASTS
jgi:hypothetical protein